MEANYSNIYNIYLFLRRQYLYQDNFPPVQFVLQIFYQIVNRKTRNFINEKNKTEMIIFNDETISTIINKVLEWHLTLATKIL